MLESSLTPNLSINFSILALRMERKPYCSGPWRWSPTRVMSLRTSVASADSEWSESIGKWPEITTYSTSLNGALTQLFIELSLADLCALALACF